MRKFRTGDLLALSFLFFPAICTLLTLHWKVTPPAPTDDFIINSFEYIAFNYHLRLWMAIICTLISGACFGILFIQFLNRKKHLTPERVATIEEIQAQIDLLSSFNYTQAYTGNLNQIEEKSYVLYADILKKLNEKRKELSDAKNKSNYARTKK